MVVFICKQLFLEQQLNSMGFTRKSYVLGSEPTFNPTMVSGYTFILKSCLSRINFLLMLLVQTQILIFVVMLAILLAYLSANRGNDMCKLCCLGFVINVPKTF